MLTEAATMKRGVFGFQLHLSTVQSSKNHTCGATGEGAAQAGHHVLEGRGAQEQGAGEADEQRRHDAGRQRLHEGLPPLELLRGRAICRLHPGFMSVLVMVITAGISACWPVQHLVGM